MTDTPEGFFTRWSRLKRAHKQVRRGRAAPVVTEERDRTEERSVVAALPPQRESAVGETSPVSPPPAAAEGRVIGPADLPSIESLDRDSDFSMFMKEGVPDELRQLALRKLWRLSPGILDGLDDYDEDYSLVKMVAEKVSGVYKGGQGVPRPGDEEALGEGKEAEAGPAPSVAREDDAKAEETTDASHDSDAAGAPGDPKEGTGKA